MELPEPIPITNETSKKNNGKNADMVLNHSLQAIFPTTTIPNNCPTDCSTLLNSNGTKTWTSISNRFTLTF